MALTRTPAPVQYGTALPAPTASIYAQVPHQALTDQGLIVPQCILENKALAMPIKGSHWDPSTGHLQMFPLQV